LRFLMYDDPKRNNLLLARLFGRGWEMLQVVPTNENGEPDPNGERKRGALCKVDPELTAEAIPNIVKQLTRLKLWADYFGLTDTKLPAILDWVKSGPHNEPLILNNPIQNDFIEY